MTNEVMGLLNLHDVFLNASIQRKAMHAAPIVEEADNFHFSDRGRFERAWAAFLYVLIESWRSYPMASVREYIASRVDLTNLNAVLDEGDQSGHIAKLRDVRHYMCHRDRREYWDDGRLGVLLQLEYNEKLHMAFSKVLLEVMKSVKSSPAAGVSA